MREFKSLQPDKLPDGFDAQVHGEQPLVEVAEVKGKIVISYTFPGFYLVADSRDVKGVRTEFKQVNISKVGFLAEGGKPLLPSFGRYVQIPGNMAYKVSVSKGKKVQFDNVRVLPAQQRVTDSPGEKHVFEYDRDFYKTDTLYPEEMVRVSGPFEIDDYRALLVHVCPFQYNPAKKTLLGYGNLVVAIEIKPEKAARRAPAAAGFPVDREAFGNLFLNPGRAIEDRLGIDPGTILARLTGPEFLIIHAAFLKEAAEKLANWKNRRGLITELVAIDVIGNDVAAIKKHVRTLRRKPGSRLRYVLLLGDIEQITPEIIAGGAWGDNATDYYYSTEVDAATATTTLLPWLSVGRIPVQTKADGMGVVDQIIAYEKKPPIDPNYYRRMAFAAFFQEDDAPGEPGYGTDDRGFLRTIEDLRSYMVSLGFDAVRVYVSGNPSPQFYNDGTPIPADVKAAFVDLATATTMLVDATTEGQLIIAHRDHGSPDGWAHPPFTRASLDGVTGDMPSLFFSINCLTGQFDLPSPTESFAEKNLRMKGTAPSLIAATRVSHTWLNNYLIRALFDALFSGVLPTFPGGTASFPVKFNRLGDMLNYAKTYLPIASTDSVYIKDHFEIYHVVGDPALEIWKETPRVVKIRAAITLSTLNVRLSECPKGSVITVWSGDKMLKRLEPSSTHFTIPLRGIVALPRPPLVALKPPLVVCLWAPGCRFSEVKVSRLT